MKEEKEKKYLLPQRVSRNQVNLYEVSEETYKESSREINRIRKEAQRNGECYCTKNKFWQCDGCCIDCPFYHSVTSSFDDVVYRDDKGENDLTLADVTPDKSFGNTPEGMMFNVLVDELKDTLARIDPKARQIFDAIYEKTITNDFDSLRAVAEELGIPWSTFHDKLVIVQEWAKKYLEKN